LSHLCLAPEEFIVWLSVAAPETVPESGKLPIVVVEVEMVHSVASGAIDHGTVGNIFTVMNQDRPEVDESEKEYIGKLLKRENEGEHVVRDTLGPAINGVEGMGSEGARHNPLVMRLVKFLVHEWMVQAPVDPVDEEIRKGDEQWEL